MTLWTLFNSFRSNIVLENGGNIIILTVSLAKIPYLKKYWQYLSPKTTFFTFIKMKQIFSAKMESYKLLLDLIGLLNIHFSFL